MSNANGQPLLKITGTRQKETLRIAWGYELYLKIILMNPNKKRVYFCT